MNKPEIDPVNNFYLQAFYDLGTCRNIGQVMGPIPWNIIVQYADYYGLEIDITDLFIRVVRSLDLVYLDWCKEAAEKIKNLKRGKTNARFSNTS